jgi:type III secretory pathway component EscT
MNRLQREVVVGYAVGAVIGFTVASVLFWVIGWAPR